MVAWGLLLGRNPSYSLSPSSRDPAGTDARPDDDDKFDQWSVTTADVGELEGDVGEQEPSVGEQERGVGEQERGVSEQERGVSELERGVSEQDRGVDEQDGGVSNEQGAWQNEPDFPAGLCLLNFCQHASDSWGEHIQHLREHHFAGEASARVCSLCAHFSPTAALAEQHRLVHEDPTEGTVSQQCPLCPAELVDIGQFRDHLWWFHRQNRQTLYEFCS